MGANEIFQAVVGGALAIIFLIYGNKMFNSMELSEPKEKKH